MTPALQAARDRLRDALIAGTDTSVHRAAIGRLEADAADAARREAEHRGGAEAERRAAVTSRADEIVLGVQSRLDELIGALPPIPELEKNQ